MLSKLGDASYALYLTHGFVMTAYARLLLDARIAHALPLAVWMSLAVAFSIALGVATHHLIERPLARAVKKLERLGLSRVPETPVAAD
jgi:peptidoglycan/LPS O-acetylase OafA/YrhL